MNELSCYFDYAAASPLSDIAYTAMKPVLKDNFYNPSAVYAGGVFVRDQVERARSSVARCVEVKTNEVVFTNGCTEANNLAIHGTMRNFPGGKVLVSAIEHDSVRAPAEQYTHEEIPVDATGIVDMSVLASMIDDSVVLISVMAVNNETGVVQPVREIAELIKKIRKARGVGSLPLYLHTDAAQLPLYMSVTRSSLGADYISLNGGKIYGPKASGCLIVTQGVPLHPIIDGGGQERGLRSGTENVSGILGFAAALVDATKHRTERSKKITSLRSLLVELLEPLHAVMHADTKLGIPHIISCAFEGADNEALVYHLSQNGFSVAMGSACHAKNQHMSHVLAAMGVSTSLADATIRISLGDYTTPESIKKLVSTIKEFLKKA